MFAFDCVFVYCELTELCEFVNDIFVVSRITCIVHQYKYIRKCEKNVESAS